MLTEIKELLLSQTKKKKDNKKELLMLYACSSALINNAGHFLLSSRFYSGSGPRLIQNPEPELS